MVDNSSSITICGMAATPMTDVKPDAGVDCGPLLYECVAAISKHGF